MLTSGRVTSISRSGSFGVNSLGNTRGVNWPGKNMEFSAWVLHVDEDFAKTYKIEIEQGRFYSKDFPTDFTGGFVLNSAAIKEMGFENPIGREISVWGRKGKIIGVTNNFNFTSLHNNIEPLLLRIPEPNEVNSRCKTLSMRIAPNSITETLKFIELEWNYLFPEETFAFYFMDYKLKTNYVSEMRIGKLFGYFSFLVILIACLGLYGLTAFSIEQKTKEIGMYKVLGATISNVIIKFTKGYVSWILIATVIASPIAWFAMHKWLENFAYKTTLSWWIFALAGVLALGIALLTVSWQSWKAATRNPVEALRYE